MNILTLEEFKSYIDRFKFTRKIKRVQLHHTFSPSYKDFNGKNHQALQNNMRNYHMKNNDWADIGQNITIFPDGKVVLGRDLNKAPAGIFGANSDGICIECLGNFDKGGDVMTDAQKNAIIGVVRILLNKLGLNAQSAVTYHAWWTISGVLLHTYIKGRSAKTCPGTSFFGGNTKEAFEKNLLPELSGELTSVNDIIWELTDKGIMTDGKLWMKKCAEDTNVYWLCRKFANYIRGITR